MEFYLISGAFILGLLVSGWSWGWLFVGVIAILGGVASFQIFSLPSWRYWAIAGVLAVSASPYLYLRNPHPAPNDLRWLAPEKALIIQGTVLESPRLHAGFQSFVLEAHADNHVGKLFVRAPLTVTVHLQDLLKLEGTLQEPLEAQNPQAFDFRNYLQKQGIFATFQARQVFLLRKATPGWLEQVREKILSSHENALGQETGSLFTSLILGSEVVDLPKATQDRYRNIGLSHLLAASGTQVSLVLSACLAFVRGRSPKTQVLCGSLGLAIFICLSGATPAILRAGLMGAATLVGIATERKVDSLKALVFAAAVLLVMNPLWIWDLGFLFSFLATLGLIVTAPKLVGALSWLPPLLATPLAVTLAASLWTMPLQLLDFGQWSPYALPLNLFAVPCVEILTLGGMVTSLLALIAPPLARIGDYPLGWILQVLDGTVLKVNGLPGSLLYPGLLLPIQMFCLYGLIVIGHVLRPVWPFGLAGMSVLVLPGLLPGGPEVALSILAAGSSEVAVFESKHQTVLLNGGNDHAVTQVLIPYLQRRGRTQLDALISTGTQAQKTGGLNALLASIEVGTFVDGATPPLSKNYQQTLDQLPILKTLYQPLQSLKPNLFENQVQLQATSSEPPILLLKTQNWNILLLGNLSLAEQEWLSQTSPDALSKVHFLWASSKQLSDSILQLPNLQGVLVSGNRLTKVNQSILEERKIPCWFTGKSGGITWQSSGEHWSITTTREDRPKNPN
ncbi:MAG: ComEC/Rec2 family competence protein [Anaerolineae bacterium]|nr:ComEC/Rec2 family competence protein [Gloeobacterales cyanobacterium ES-bin-313]